MLASTSAEEPDVGKRWLTFLRNHRDAIAAMDLCPKDLCHLRGSPQEFPSNFRPIQGQDKQG
jgi:hypothetical protein